MVRFPLSVLEDQYFTVAFLPPVDTTLKDHAVQRFGGHRFNGTEEAYPGFAAGGEGRNQMGLFVGPKEGRILEAVNPNLSHVIDWGWFRIIAQPLFMMLRVLNNKFIHNYGWSIIVLTLFIRSGYVSAEDYESEVDAKDAGCSSRRFRRSTTSTRASA